MTPIVSFVVPCYKLGHLLRDCIHSILMQTYQEFEILIMDDCSPDGTAEISHSYTDTRIKYNRNTVNMGHLRNYNAGISRACGKYVWLISADDCLRSPRVLEQYVAVMEQHPAVGFVFCPAVGLGPHGESDVLRYSVRGDHDTIFRGREFLSRYLLDSDCVVVASAMARKDCYTSVSMYPEDMPYAGDWYIWSIFSLHYDVAYLASPMVCYREHDLSMTNKLKRQDARILVEDDLKVLWRMREAASAKPDALLMKRCDAAIVKRYALCIQHEVHGLAEYRMTMEECRDSLRLYLQKPSEVAKVGGSIAASLADEQYWNGQYAEAARLYGLGLQTNPWMPSTWVKAGLLKAGKAGIRFRDLSCEWRKKAAARVIGPSRTEPVC